SRWNLIVASDRPMIRLTSHTVFPSLAQRNTSISRCDRGLSLGQLEMTVCKTGAIPPKKYSAFSTIAGDVVAKEQRVILVALAEEPLTKLYANPLERL